MMPLEHLIMSDLIEQARIELDPAQFKLLIDENKWRLRDTVTRAHLESAIETARKPSYATGVMPAVERRRMLARMSADRLRAVARAHNIAWPVSASMEELSDLIIQHEYHGATVKKTKQELLALSVDKLAIEAENTLGTYEFGQFFQPDGKGWILKKGVIRGNVVDAILEDDVPEHDMKFKTATARRIHEDIIPRWWMYFEKKNEDYGDSHVTYGLGPKGEFVGLWRKMGLLRRTIWEGKSVNHEDSTKQLYDLIGTAFLLLDLQRLEDQ